MSVDGLRKWNLPRRFLTSERRFKVRQVRPIDDPRDRIELAVLSQGRHTSLFIGTVRGECLAMLEDEALLELAAEITERRSRPTPAFEAGR